MKRGQFILYNNGQRCNFKNYIVFYTHERGQELKMVLKSVLSLKKHWEDFEYFNRILFDLLKNEEDEYYGTGISMNKHIDCETIEIYFQKKEIVIVHQDVKNEYFTFESFLL